MRSNLFELRMSCSENRFPLFHGASTTRANALTDVR